MNYSIGKGITEAYLDHITDLSIEEFEAEKVKYGIIYRITSEILYFFNAIWKETRDLKLTIKNNEIFLEETNLADFWNGRNNHTLKHFTQCIGIYKKFPKDLEDSEWNNISLRRRTRIKTMLEEFRFFLTLDDKND